MCRVRGPATFGFFRYGRRAKCLAYLRTSDDRQDHVLVPLNYGASPARVGLHAMAHLLQDAVLVDLMSGQDTSAAGARAEIQLDEFGVKLLAIMKTPRSPN